MTVVGLNPKITWQVTCQFCFWCWKINETLQLSFQRNVTLNLFYLWWSFNGQCYLDRKLKAISSKGVLLNCPKPTTEIFTFKLEQPVNDIEKRLFLHGNFLDKLYTIGYLNKYITVLKEFASFVYLAQMPALDIIVLFVSTDLQIWYPDLSLSQNGRLWLL